MRKIKSLSLGLFRGGIKNQSRPSQLKQRANQRERTLSDNQPPVVALFLSTIRGIIGRKSHHPECTIRERAPRGMLGRGVGSVQAGALAPQVPSVYARSYIRLDPISYRARESRRPSVKAATRREYLIEAYYALVCRRGFNER